MDADCNVMSAKTWIVPLGKRALTCEHKGQKYRVEFEIAEKDVPATLGGDTCVKLGFIKREHDVVKENDLLKD